MQVEMQEIFPERWHDQLPGEAVPVAQLWLTFGVLGAFDGAPEPFATSLANGYCRQQCVMLTWD
jgi:hypothetical protein